MEGSNARSPDFARDDISRQNLSYLKEIADALRRKKIVSPQVEAEILVLHFSKMNRIDYFTGRKAVAPAAKKKIEAALKRRFKGIPAAYLTGTAGFYGHDFYVTPATLIPRPETELLVEETLKILNQVPEGSDPYGTGAPKSSILSRGHRGQPPLAPRVIEVGAGSGCVAISLTIARADCRMTALELSPEALKTARKNARKHGVQRRISFFRSDLFGILGPKDRARWDVLVSNPPYIPSHELRTLQREVQQEPRLALDGGSQGLDLIQAILEEAPFYLKDGGYILLEIGKGQSKALAKKIAAMDFYQDLKFIKDYAGIDRILVARKIG